MSFINTYINGCIPPINSFNLPSRCSSSSISCSNQTCITTVYSLINYTYSYSPSNTGIGLIRYNNINITNSSVGNRIWNFTYGGYVEVPIFTTTYQFSPTCSVPTTIENATLNQINFNALNGDGEPEPLQGFIIVNNVNIPLSDAFNTSPYTTQDPLASFSWNASTATFDLHINLTAQLQNINFKQGAQNSIFVNLWIQDSLTSCTKGSKTANFTFYIRKGQWCNQNFDATNFDGDGNNYYDSTYSTGSSEIQRIYIQKDTIGTVNCNIYFLDSTGCGVSGCYKGTDKLQFEIINKSTTSCINANVNSYSCTNITNTDNYDGCSHELQDTKNACQFTGTCSSDKSSSVTNLSSSSVIIGKNTYQYWTCGNGTRGFTAD